MSDSLRNRLGELSGLEGDALFEALHGMQTELQAASLSSDEKAMAAQALVRLMATSAGAPKQRLALALLLNDFGDPRLSTPSQDQYWAQLTLKSGDTFAIGKHPVTNAEFKAFVEAGGYENRALWSDEGWAWLQSCENPWPTLAGSDEAAAFIVDNQPVVGVSLYEASAYARAHGARLPRWYERVFAVRGPEKRPYPWGSPFGEGNANSEEEVLGRPVPVGMFSGDVTPEGIVDLAGNAGEWTCDRTESGDEYLLHPGAWDQPSLACWAKALTTAKPSSRWAALGFRLARD